MSAEDILNKKVVGGITAPELIGGMGLKPFVEKGAEPFVGNGNWVSGFAKLGAALGLSQIKGKIGNTLAIAFGADGAEDIALAATKLTAVKPNAEGGF